VLASVEDEVAREAGEASGAPGGHS